MKLNIFSNYGSIKEHLVTRLVKMVNEKEKRYSQSHIRTLKATLGQVMLHQLIWYLKQ
jgi:hypothetical protein